MKIALVNSPVNRPSPHARLAPPLGLSYLAAVLLGDGHDVVAVDFNVSGLNLRRVDRLVETDKPAILGISAHTESYPNALAIARRVKALAPGTVTVMGGPHPTLLPEEVLSEDSVDFVVIGEGEATLSELVRYVGGELSDLASIQGLGSKESGKTRIGPPRPPLDPDALPFPARDLFPLELYADRWSVLTSRGACPFQCPFCSASSLWNGRRRARAPERVVAEIRMLVETHGATHVFFSDDIFTLDRNWVYQLFDRMKTLPRPLTWGCSTRVDMVGERLISDMAAAGCRTIQFGVESGNQEILDSVKGIKKDQVIRAVRAAVGNGIDVAASFMIPFPEDTKETILDTRDFMHVLHGLGCKILLAFTTPYPGTYFARHAQELGLHVLTDRWEEFDAKHNILGTARLTGDEIDRLVARLVRDVGLIRAGS